MWQLVDGQPELTGLFDFGDTMVGPPEYEVAATVLLMACHEPGGLSTLLTAYGLAPQQLDRWHGDQDRGGRKRVHPKLTRHRAKHIDGVNYQRRAGRFTFTAGAGRSVIGRVLGVSFEQRDLLPEGDILQHQVRRRPKDGSERLNPERDQSNDKPEHHPNSLP